MNQEQLDHLLPHFQTVANEIGDDGVAQCLNVSIDQSKELESLFRSAYPEVQLLSEIAIGNYGIAATGQEASLCFPVAAAKALAENPAHSILIGKTHGHVWNVLNGTIIDLTILRSIKALGGPVEPFVAWSHEKSTDRYGFNLVWKDYQTYPAQELRHLMDQYR